MDEMVLIGFGESGNTYRVAMMLELAGLKWRQQAVDFWNGETRSQAFRESVNEMGEVPVLMDGAVNLAQSGVILTYLSQKTGKLAPRADQQLEALRWLLFDNHKFTGYISILRFILGVQKQGESPVTEFVRTRLLNSAAIVDRHLAASSFMLGDTLTIVDLSMAAYLFYPEENGVDWTQFPHIKAWLSRIAATPNWRGPYDLLERAPPKRG